MRSPPSALLNLMAATSAAEQTAQHVAAAEHCAEHAALAGGDGGVDDERATSIEQPDDAAAAGQHVRSDTDALTLRKCRRAHERAGDRGENKDLLHDVSPLC